MSNPDDVLDAIDASLRDYSVSVDAMRWAPDEPDPKPEDGLALWGEYLNGDRLYRTTSPPFEFVVTHGEPLVQPAALHDLAVSLHADVSAFATGMTRAAEALATSFGEALTPVFATMRDAYHELAYKDDRAHQRRCPICNPAGFPKRMGIDRREYHRRQRRRNKR